MLAPSTSKLRPQVHCEWDGLQGIWLVYKDGVVVFTSRNESAAAAVMGILRDKGPSAVMPCETYRWLTTSR